MISSFRRKPESRLFPNKLILKRKTLDPGFRRGDVYRVFRPDVGIPILFHHPAKQEKGNVKQGAEMVFRSPLVASISGTNC
jgi:hypothetical protein